MSGEARHLLGFKDVGDKMLVTMMLVQDNDKEGIKLGSDIYSTGGIQIIINQYGRSLITIKMIQLKKSMLSVAYCCPIIL